MNEQVARSGHGAEQHASVGAPGAHVGEGNWAAQMSFILGLAGVVAVVVPPGLFVAPVLGLVAIVLGVMGYARGAEGLGGRDKAVTGLALGLVAFTASASLLFWLRHPIAEALHSLGAL